MLVIEHSWLSNRDKITASKEGEVAIHKVISWRHLIDSIWFGFIHGSKVASCGPQRIVSTI